MGISTTAYTAAYSAVSLWGQLLVKAYTSVGTVMISVKTATSAPLALHTAAAGGAVRASYLEPQASS